MRSEFKNWLVGSVIVGMLLGLFVIWYATEQKNTRYGPSKIRVTQLGEIWVLSDGKLHVLDSAGSLKRAIPLDHLGRAALQSDFFPLEDGSILLAEPETHEIYRCHLDAQCKPLLTPAGISTVKTKNAMLLAVDEAKQRLFMADNAGHRLLLLDLDGKLLSATGKLRSRFFYPNQIELQGSDLLVADTNHRRIVRVSVVGDRFDKESWVLPTSDAKVRSGRKWPMSFLVLPDGQWWVAIAQEGMRGADVARFDATGHPIDYIALENNADPVSMVAVNDRVLIADTEGYRIRQFGSRGNPLVDFGSTAFREELARLAQRASNWRMARIAAQVSVIVLPLLGIFMLWRLGEKPISAPLALSFEREPRAIEPGVAVWLSPSPKFIQQQTLMLMLLSIAMMVLCGWSIWIGVSVTLMFPQGGWLLAGLMFFAPLLVFLVLIAAYKVLRSRLGTDGMQLLHDKGDGKVFAYPLAQTLSDNYRLLAGPRIIVMRIGRRMIFDREDLESLILARMSPASQRGFGQFYLAGLRRRNRTILLHTTVIGLIFVVLAITRLTNFSLTQFLIKLVS